MKKRILSMFLAAIMVFTSVDITAFAQDFNSAELGTIIGDEIVQEEGTVEPTEVVEDVLEEPIAEPTEVPEDEGEVPTEEPESFADSSVEPSEVPIETPEMDEEEKGEVTPSATLEPSESADCLETPENLGTTEEKPLESPDASETPENTLDISESSSMTPVLEEDTFRVQTNEEVVAATQGGSLTPDDIVVGDDEYVICVVDTVTNKIVDKALIAIDNMVYETNGVMYIEINENGTWHNVEAFVENYETPDAAKYAFTIGAKTIIRVIPIVEEEYEFSYVEGILTATDPLIPAIWVDGVEYKSDDSYYVGDALQFLNENVTCVLRNGLVIDVRSTTPKYYGTTKYKTTPEERIQKAIDEYCDAMDGYLQSIVEAAKEDVKDVENNYAEAGKKLREADEASNDRIISLQAGAPEAAIDSTYQVLAMMFESWTQEGIDLGKVNVKDDEIVISAKILNKIYNNLDSTSITRRVNGYTVTINVFAKFGGAYTGQIVVSGSKGYYTGVVNSRVSDTADVMTEYINEMSEMVNDLHKQALLSVIEELGENIGIGEISKKELKKIFNDKLAIMKKGGYGNVLKKCTKLVDLYEKLKLNLLFEDAKDIYDSYKEIKDLYEELKELDHSDDVEKGPIRIAIEKLKSAKSNLIDELYNYLYSVEPPKDESFGDWFKRVFIQCPVDFEVYCNDQCIGYVKNGIVYSESGIKIEVDNDVKTLYVPGDMDVNIKFIGTGTGVMNYVLEEYQNGQPIGRMNYYDIPLSEGITYSQYMDAGAWSEYLFTFPIMASDGSAIYANEYFAADNMSASVNISCTADVGGVVIGGGDYPKGNPVKLSTRSIDSEYRFAGWYVNDTLVEEDNDYYFTALNDINVHAAFVKKDESSIVKWERNSDYKATLYEYYDEFAGVDIYKNANGHDDIALRVLGADPQDDYSKVLVKGYNADGVEILNQEKTTVFDNEFSYWIKDINLTGYEKIKLYDTTGRIISIIVHIKDYIELEDLIITENMTLYGNYVCANLEIRNGATFNLNGYTLTVADDAIISGTINMGNGKLNIVGKVCSDGKNIEFINGRVNVYGPVEASTLKLQNSYILTENKVDIYRITLSNAEMIVNGDVKSNGEITFNNGTVLVEGNLSYGGISMSDTNDMLKVKGNFIGKDIAGFSTSSLKTGTIMLYGDVYQDKVGIVASGSHKVVFCGTEKQTIESTQSTYRYNMVEFLNDNIVIEGYFSAEKLVSDMNFIAEDAYFRVADVNGCTIEVEGDVTLFDDFQLNGGEFYANDNVIVNGTLSFKDGKFEVSGNLELCGKLGLNGGELFVKQDFYMGSAFTMKNDNDYVDVDGNIIINREYNDSYSILEAGTIRLAGNLIETAESGNNYFRCSGTHKIILDGEKEQTISGLGRFDKFNELIVENQNPIRVSGYLEFAKLIGNIDIISEDLLIKSLGTEEAIDLNGYDVLIYGDVEFHAAIKLAGGKLQVQGDVIQSAGKTIIDGGYFLVDGDYSLKVFDSIDYYDYSMGGIIMENEEDVFEVRGTLYLPDASYSECCFEAGTMLLYGDIVGYYENRYRNSEVFTGTHKTVFCGEEQHVIMSEQSRFNEVEFRNTGIIVEEWFNAEWLVSDGKIITTGTNAKLGWVGFNGKTLEVEGNIEIRPIIKSYNNSAAFSDNYLDIAKGELIVSGNLNHSGGNIYFSGGKIHVLGNYYSNDIYSADVWKLSGADKTVRERWGSCTLVMLQDEDVFDVDGDLQIVSNGWNNSSVTIKAGKIFVGGNININADSKGAPDYDAKYDMQGTNIVILDGDDRQEIILDENGSEFNTLQLTKELSNYAFYPNPCWKKLIEKGDDGQLENELWYEDWEYVLDGTEIILKRFNEEVYGTHTEIIIPSTAKIDDKSYSVVLQGTNSSFDTTFSKAVQSITVKSGVRAAEDISYLFYGCEDLVYLEVDKLDTSNVINMDCMFGNCKALQELDLNGLKTSNVTSMDGMFSWCSSLTQLDLSSFNTFKVTSMFNMFGYCKKLESINVSSFDTSSVLQMESMFQECNELKELDISSFDTRNVEYMSNMFAGCSSIRILDLSGFDTSNVTHMRSMFSGCSSLKEVDVTSFNTKNVIYMGTMFSGCNNLLELDLSRFDTSNVTDMENMFMWCYKLQSINLSGFDTGKVEDFGGMFEYCYNLKTLDLSGFDTTSAKDLGYMFAGCKSLKTLDLSSFKTENVSKMNNMFYLCTALQTINFGDFNTEKISDMSSVFEECHSLVSIDISKFNTSIVTDFERMFKNCYSLSELKLPNFDTQKATTMKEMFFGCKNLMKLDLSTYDTSSVISMEGMFEGCEGLEDLDISSFDTGNVTSFKSMFADCKRLKQIAVDSFSTEKATIMNGMFSGCECLESIDVSDFNVAKVTDMANMFRGCKKVKELDLSGFNASGISNMRNIFDGCESVQVLDLSGFDVSNCGSYALALALRNTVSLKNIYVPKNVKENSKVNLYGIYEDSTGEEYSVLPEARSTSMLLERKDTSIDVTSINVSSYPSSILRNSISSEMSITCYPLDATDQRVSIISSDATIATVDSKGRIHSYDKSGTATITVTSVSNPEITKSFEIVVVYEYVHEIALDNERLSLNVGEKARLDVDVISGNNDYLLDNYLWTSNDATIATVDEKGNVSAISEGSTTVVCAYKYDTSVTASCQVTVTPRIEVESLNILQDAVTIEKNYSVNLNAIITPSNATNTDIIWVSNNESIATVNSKGIVVGVSAGEAEITAKSADNETIFDSCKVTVIAQRVPVQYVVLDYYTLTLKEGQEQKIAARVYPENADNKKIIWKSSNTSVITVNQDGVVSAVQAGNAYVTATAEDGNITSYCQVQVTAVYADEVIISNKEKMLEVGQEYQLLVELLPIDSKQPSWTWSSSDDSIAQVSENGRVTAVKEGICTITVQSDDARLQASCIISVIKEGTAKYKNLWIYGIDHTYYTGAKCTHNIRVFDGEKELTEGKDYTCSYKNNKSAYVYADEDYATFEEKLRLSNKKVTVGTFNPEKAPQVTIKMLGNYSGNKTLYFKIMPQNIEETDFTVADLLVTYTGEKQTPAPILKWKGNTLKYGTDFYVPEYIGAKKDKKAFTNSQIYNLTVVGKNNYYGEIPITLTISESKKQVAISNVSVKGLKDLQWTGEQCIQEGIKVTYKRDVLSETNGDFTISWGENKDVGTGTLTLTGTGEDSDGDGYSYIGTKKISFRINGISMGKVSVAGIEEKYYYTGNAIMPEAILTYKASKRAEPVYLLKDTHYTVEYKKNIIKGTATIVYKGIPSSGYSGTKKVTFKIVANKISVDQIKVDFKDVANLRNGIYVASYMKGGVKPEVVVTSGNRILKKGKDYTVSYDNNKKIALSTAKNAPTITIKGTGNYSGSRKLKFTIVGKRLSKENGITLIAKDKVVSKKKNGYRQSFVVYDADGKQLGNSDYYAATYTLIQTKDSDGNIIALNQVLNKSSIVPANSVIRITVSGKGNYSGGVVSGTYRILGKGYDIGEAVIQIKNQTYTGNEIQITNQDQFKVGKVYLKVGNQKRMLLLGNDIEVLPGSYVKNVKKGTAKVTFRGINDFGGTLTVSFKIGTRSIASFWEGVCGDVVTLFD